MVRLPGADLNGQGLQRVAQPAVDLEFHLVPFGHHRRFGILQVEPERWVICYPVTPFAPARYGPIVSLLVRSHLQSRLGVGDREDFGLEAPAAGQPVIQDFDAADDGPLVPGKRQWEIVVVFARDRVYGQSGWRGDTHPRSCSTLTVNAAV